MQAQSVERRNLSFQNKTVPASLSEEIKEALSYFPELWKTKIDFVFRDNIKNAVMQAQPRVRTLFKKKVARTYKIKISKFLKLGDQIKPIEEVPHDILVGWLAHELGHVMDYVDRSSFQMIGFGFNYLTSRAFLKNAELEADRYAISHGCADLIIKTKKYILNHEHLPEDYKARIDDLYLSPEEVRLMEEELNTDG
ncbi:hypothetical protein E1176_15315 [Fulvivirga sp. RKSG066]|uniref:hypothetical protein n=1 Tax=Fulvivirga aurantia TaxID=2529383 RepID=UPI0012BBC230|nr:hypothetical protein [Fulvivirga aurantia]MTI22400.1 hypothetical protein [Fulvivirga aurantia]